MTTVLTRTRAIPSSGAVAAGVVAAVCYSSFLLSPLTGATGGTSGSFVSVLEEAGQPYAWLYRLSDAIAGLAVLLIAGVLVAVPGRRRWVPAGAALMGVVGLASVLDGLTTMRCDPATDAACAAGEGNVPGLLGQLSGLHTDTGLLGFLGAAAGAIVLGGAVFERWPGWGCAQVGLGVTIALCGLLDLVLLLAHHDIGTVERIRVLLTSAWFVTVALFLGQLRSDPHGVRRQR